MSSTKIYLASMLALACVLGSGCATRCVQCDRIFYVDKPARIKHFPQERIAAAAPPSSLVRCESLPDLTLNPGTATVKQLLIEINRARSAYAECANRHNVLIEFEKALERSMLEVLNHYQYQK